MGGVSPHREHTQRLVAKSFCNLDNDLGEANPFTLLVSNNKGAWSSRHGAWGHRALCRSGEAGGVYIVVGGSGQGCDEQAIDNLPTC